MGVAEHALARLQRIQEYFLSLRRPLAVPVARLALDPLRVPALLIARSPQRVRMLLLWAVPPRLLAPSTSRSICSAAASVYYLKKLPWRESESERLRQSDVPDTAQVCSPPPHRTRATITHPGASFASTP
jgi:hypothetical protein